MKKIISMVALVLVLTGCSTAGKRMHNLSPGLAKHQVIRILGHPRRTKTFGNVQVLHYQDERSFRTYDYYFVRLVDGRVESFGTETKEQRVTATEPPLKQ